MSLPPALTILDMPSGRVVARFPLEDFPYPGLNAHAGRFSIGSVGITEIDPATGRKLRRINSPLDETNHALALGRDMWFTGRRDLVRVDLHLGREVDRYRLVDREYPSGLVGLATGAGSLWVASKEAGEVLRVNPANGRVQARIAMKSPWWLAYAYRGGVGGVGPGRATANRRLHEQRHRDCAGTQTALMGRRRRRVRLDGERDQGHRLQGRPDGRNRGDVPDGRRRALGQLRKRGALGRQLRRRHLIGNRRGIRRRPHVPLRSPGRRRRRRWPVCPAVHRRRPDGRGPHLGPARGRSRSSSSPSSRSTQPTRPSPRNRSRSRSGGPSPRDRLPTVVGAGLRPELAASMPTVSADGRTYTFRIRRNFGSRLHRTHRSRLT